MAHRTIIRDVSDHLRVYLMAGTLFAVGMDVAGRGTDAHAVTALGGALPTDGAAEMVTLSILVHGLGWLIAAAGSALYLGNMWDGFVALRKLQPTLSMPPVLVAACGCSLAIAYIAVSAAIGLAVNAVYLALVT